MNYLLFFISQGSYPSATVAVSIEGGAFYYWISGSAYFMTSLDESEYKNQWVNFSASKEGSSTRVFMNGTQIGSTINNVDNLPIEPFTIGNEELTSPDAAFGGYLSGFKIDIGIALYTTNYTVSSSPPILDAFTEALLFGNDDYSGSYSGTITNTDITSTTENPYSDPVPCFGASTTVLCLCAGIETYVPIVNLELGMLVKTLTSGYRRITGLSRKTIQNPSHRVRVQNRVYVCHPDQYPELTSSLFLTGGHAILVDSLTAEQMSRTRQSYGDLFYTENKYRFMAYLDDRASMALIEDELTYVYHVALENDLCYNNYGIYVNGGLLVESCSEIVLQRM